MFMFKTIIVPLIIMVICIWKSRQEQWSWSIFTAGFMLCVALIPLVRMVFELLYPPIRPLASLF